MFRRKHFFEHAVGPTRERYSRLQKELPFVATDVQEGADLVHRYYISEGYLDGGDDSPQYHFSADGRRQRQPFPVHEGRQYFFGDLIFHGQHHLRSGNVARPDARLAFATVHRSSRR